MPLEVDYELIEEETVQALNSAPGTGTVGWVPWTAQRLLEGERGWHGPFEVYCALKAEVANRLKRTIRPKKRDLPRTAPCTVVCRGDGNQVSAIIDPDHWPHQGGVAGFGDDLPAALRDLADNIEQETEYEAHSEVPQK